MSFIAPGLFRPRGRPILFGGASRQRLSGHARLGHSQLLVRAWLGHNIFAPLAPTCAAGNWLARLVTEKASHHMCSWLRSVQLCVEALQRASGITFHCPQNSQPGIRAHSFHYCVRIVVVVGGIIGRRPVWSQAGLVTGRLGHRPAWSQAGSLLPQGLFNPGVGQSNSFHQFVCWCVVVVIGRSWGAGRHGHRPAWSQAGLFAGRRGHRPAWSQAGLVTGRLGHGRLGWARRRRFSIRHHQQRHRQPVGTARSGPSFMQWSSPALFRVSSRSLPLPTRVGCAAIF